MPMGVDASISAPAGQGGGGAAVGVAIAAAACVACLAALCAVYMRLYGKACMRRLGMTRAHVGFQSHADELRTSTVMPMSAVVQSPLQMTELPSLAPPDYASSYRQMVEGPSESDSNRLVAAGQASSTSASHC